MRLTPEQREFVNNRILDFSGIISDAKTNGKNLGSIYNAMMVFPSADLDEKYASKKMDDFLPEEEILSHASSAGPSGIAKVTKEAALTYIAGIYAIDREVSKRTWKDFFKHPFKFIGEKLAYADQKQRAKAKFGFSENQFKLAMDNLAEIYGDPRRHGTVDPKAEPVKEEEPVKKEEEVYVPSAAEIQQEKEFSEQMKKENERIFGELHRDDELDNEKLGKDVSLEQNHPEKSKPVEPQKKDPTIQVDAPKNE